MNAALELDRIEYAYRRNTALRGVSLQLKPGEVVAVTGASGCGKSTLLHCAAGILTPDAGAVQVDGQDLAALPEEQRAALRRTKVGIVLQFGQLVPDLPLVDNVALPLLLGGHERGEAHKAAMNWLDQVGIADDADAVPGELSGGQTQRAAVARTGHRSVRTTRRRAHRQSGQSGRSGAPRRTTGSCPLPRCCSADGDPRQPGGSVS